MALWWMRWTEWMRWMVWINRMGMGDTGSFIKNYYWCLHRCYKLFKALLYLTYLD